MLLQSLFFLPIRSPLFLNTGKIKENKTITTLGIENDRNRQHTLTPNQKDKYVVEGISA